MDLSSQSDDSLNLDSSGRSYSEDECSREDNDYPYMNHDPETIDFTQLCPESTVLLNDEAFKAKQKKLLQMKVCFLYGFI